MIRSIYNVFYKRLKSTVASDAVLRSVSQQSCTKKSRVAEPPWRILFFGNDQFSLESLKPLYAKLNTNTIVSCLEVVTGQCTLVRKFCEEEQLVVHEWPLDSSSIADKFHLGLVVSFGHMIPRDVIDSFPLGCINVHSSILPKYRGAAPVVHAVLNGDCETGVTIMKIHPLRFDVGDIVRQYRVSILPDETAFNLEKRLALCGSQLMMECLRDLPKCLQTAVPQPTEGVSYAPKLKASMAMLDWQKLDAHRVYNMHRALSHVYHLVTTWHGTKLKLLDVGLDTKNLEKNYSKPPLEFSTPPDEVRLRKSALNFLNSNSNKPPTHLGASADAGRVEFLKSEKVLQITCKDDAVVVVNRLKIGGKTLTALDFFNGYMTKRPKEQWRFGL